MNFVKEAWPNICLLDVHKLEYMLIIGGKLDSLGEASPLPPPVDETLAEALSMQILAIFFIPAYFLIFVWSSDTKKFLSSF